MTDADRFEAFVRTYQDLVYALAVRLLGGSADAEDIAQTVFLRAYERFDDVVANPSAPGWLKTVTRNLCLNHLSRYRSRWRFFSELGSSTDAGQDAGADLPAHGSLARDMEDADEREQLERALRELPDHQRVPIVLFHFDEMSYQDIAAALGVSLSKVKTDIHRGREALRRHIDRSHVTG